MNIRRHLIEELGNLNCLRTHALGAAKQFARRGPEGTGDLCDGRERRITAAALDGAEVVRREFSTCGQLLEREPERLAPPSYSSSE